MEFRERILLHNIRKWLFKHKAIVITGARQVGKTTLLELLFDKQEVLWLNADLSSVRARLSNPNPEQLKVIIGDKKVVVIDEVQRIENAGLLLKILVDNFKRVQIVATGSSALEISERIFEPLTGRYLLFHLYPFSLKEFYPKHSSFEMEQTLPFHLVHGMYPDICNHKVDAETLLNNLAGQYLYKDVLVWKDIRKPELLDQLLRLLALQLCSEVSMNELANQLKVKSETIANYLDLLEKSFVIYRLKSYSTNPRKEVTKMSKVLFWDNGIRNAILGDFRPLELRNDKGELWENFIISERIKLNQWLHPQRKSFFWRDTNQYEVDYVEVDKGKLAAYEMKWSTTKKHKVTRVFSGFYPDAELGIITPEHFNSFLKVKY
ncbi:MAG: ATP-binding protein [Bacteroidetes bacterium]|nr:ATP-binding protein [Bacteroidota bacterium]